MRQVNRQKGRVLGSASLWLRGVGVTHLAAHQAHGQADRATARLLDLLPFHQACSLQTSPHTRSKRSHVGGITAAAAARSHGHAPCSLPNLPQVLNALLLTASELQLLRNLLLCHQTFSLLTRRWALPSSSTPTGSECSPVDSIGAATAARPAALPPAAQVP